MPLSSVLGASSVIKPGVCTSTTRPSVPYTGQLIYETDTRRVAAWNGSAWIYETAAEGPPGLVYMTGASFTTVTSVSLPTGTFSSTYRNYKVIFNITAQTGSVALSLRLRASGADDTTTNYYAGSPGSAAATTSNQGDNANSSFTLGTTFNNTTQNTILSVDAITPQLSTTRTMLVGNLLFGDTGGTLTGRAFNSQFSATTSFDSMTLISSVASSISGVYRVYGYADL